MLFAHVLFVFFIPTSGITVVLFPEMRFCIPTPRPHHAYSSRFKGGSLLIERPFPDVCIGEAKWTFHLSCDGFTMMKNEPDGKNGLGLRRFPAHPAECGRGLEMRFCFYNPGRCDVNLVFDMFENWVVESKLTPVVPQISCWTHQTEYEGGDILRKDFMYNFELRATCNSESNPELQCQEFCQEIRDCVGFTYNPTDCTCWPKSKMKRKFHFDRVSGPIFCDGSSTTHPVHTTTHPHNRTTTTTRPHHHNTTTSTTKPHHNTTTSTTKPHHNTTTSTTKPHHNTTTSTTKPHHNTTTSTTKPHHNTTTSTTKPRHNTTTSTTKPHHNTTTSTTKPKHNTTTSTTTSPAHNFTTTPIPHTDEPFAAVLKMDSMGGNLDSACHETNCFVKCAEEYEVFAGRTLDGQIRVELISDIPHDINCFCNGQGTQDKGLVVGQFEHGTGLFEMVALDNRIDLRHAGCTLKYVVQNGTFLGVSSETKSQKDWLSRHEALFLSSIIVLVLLCGSLCICFCTKKTEQIRRSRSSRSVQSLFYEQEKKQSDDYARDRSQYSSYEG